MSNFKRFVTWFLVGAGTLAMTLFGSGVAFAGGGNNWQGNRDRNQINPLVRTNQFDFNRNRNRDRDFGNQFNFVDMGQFNRNRGNNGGVRVLCRYLRNHLDSRADFQAYLRLCLNNRQIDNDQFGRLSGAWDRGNDQWNRDGRRGDLRNRDFSEVINLSEQSSFNLSETVNSQQF